MANCGPLVLPSDMLRSFEVDSKFTAEKKACGENYGLFDSNSLAVNLRFLEADLPLLYRGWMLSADEYSAMASALKVKGYDLAVDIEAYLKVHETSGWLEHFRGITPKSAIIAANASPEDVNEAAESIGSEKFFLKGLTKSEKHSIELSVANSARDVPELVERFVRSQDGFSNGEKLVLREFVEIDKTVPELRSWWADGYLVDITVHPDFDGEPIIDLPSEDLVSEVGSRLDSLGTRFVTVDFARLLDGSWIVVELGDGQVSGFPKSMDLESISDLLSAVQVILSGRSIIPPREISEDLLKDLDTLKNV